jgi:hypothetical protein
MMKKILAFLAVIGLCAAPIAARSPVPVGTFALGANDGITDVPGVFVAHVTKFSGEGKLVPGVGPVRTGATAIVPNADVWNKRPAAATFDLNGNGEMTGAHWIDEAGFLETPVVLTNTLNVGRVDNGVVSWMIKRWPGIGVTDDVPLPAVAECDDQGLNDIQGRHVSEADVVSMLDGAHGGDFPRGAVGAGTGMRAFGFKAGIGSSSRVLPKILGGYTVGVLLNANTGSRSELTIGGVHVGRALANELLPALAKRAAYVARPRVICATLQNGRLWVSRARALPRTYRAATCSSRSARRTSIRVRERSPNRRSKTMNRTSTRCTLRQLTPSNRRSTMRSSAR